MLSHLKARQASPRITVLDMSLDIAFLVYPGSRSSIWPAPTECSFAPPAPGCTWSGRHPPLVSDTDAALVPTAIFADVRAAEVFSIPGGGKHPPRRSVATYCTRVQH